MSYPQIAHLPFNDFPSNHPPDAVKNQDALVQLEEYVKSLVKETGTQDLDSLSCRASLVHNEKTQMCSVETILGLLFTANGNSKFNELSNAIADFFFVFITKPIFQLFQIECKSQKERQNEHIKTIISDLEYRSAICLEKRLKVERALDENNTGELKGTLLALVGSTNCNTVEHKKIVDLLAKNKVYEAFCYHHARMLAQEIDDETEKKKALALFDMCFKEVFDPSKYTQLVDISSRLQCKKQIMDLVETDKAANQFDKKNALVDALSNNDETGFCALFSELSKKVQNDSEDLMQKAIFRDLAYYFQNSSKSIPWNQIARQIRKEQHLDHWERRLGGLVDVLQKNAIEESIDVDRLSTLFGNISSLYRYYNALIEKENPSEFPSLLHAAKIGNLKRSWRKINEFVCTFFRNKNASEGPSHLLCDCKDLACKTPKNEKESLKGKEKAIDRVSRVAFGDEKKEKTALFLYCNYGGGHRSAMHAVSEYLATNSEENDYSYHIKKCDVPIDVLLSKDTLHNMFGKMFDYVNGEWIYNTLLQKDRVDLIAILKEISSAEPTVEEKESIKSLIRCAILKESPDILFMSYTFHNMYIEEVAHELGIPLVHISTDFDLSGWKKAPTHPHFSMAVALGNENTLKTLDGIDGIRKDQITVTGPCVRTPFLQPLSQERIAQIKGERNIDPQAKVLVYSSGAKGVHSDIPEIITMGWNESDAPIHLIVITGENETYKEHLEKTLLPKLSKKNVKLEILGSCNANQMHEFLSIADVPIGKPGGMYSFEIFSLGTNFLADMSSTRFSWENINFDVLKALGQADSFDNKRALIAKIKELIQKPRVQRDFDIQTMMPQRKYVQLSKKLILDSENDETFIEKRRMWNLSKNTNTMIY